MGMKVKTKSKKVNKAWLNQHVNDPYVRLAQKDGFRARAAYKLKEIDETLGLIRPGDVIVIAGKGHEATQTIGTDARPFDDRLVARDAILATIGTEKTS